MAVRLTGGNDITPAVSDFMSRYGVRGYPTLYVMNAEGHVLSGVAPNYVPRSVDGMLGALKGAEAIEADFAKIKAAAGESDENKAAYAEALETRMAWDELLAMHEAAVAKAPSAELHEKIAQIYTKVGRGDDELALRKRMIELYPDAEERPDWRLRLATHVMDGVRSREEFTEKAGAAIENLRGLVAKADEEKDGATSAAASATLGNLLVHPLIGKGDEGRPILEGIIEKHADTKYAPQAMMALANVEWRAQDFAGCKEWLQKILDKYPDSDEAKTAPRGIENCDKRLGQ